MQLMEPFSDMSCLPLRTSYDGTFSVCFTGTRLLSRRKPSPRFPSIHSSCTFMWINKVLRYVNLFPHVQQGYGFSPVWILMCVKRLLLRLKHFPHVLQEWDFSPVWIVMWVNRLLLRVKFFPHILQTWDFSPVWMLMWLNKPLFRVKPFPQVSQECSVPLVLAWTNKFSLSPVWSLWCSSASCLSLKASPQ